MPRYYFDVFDGESDFHDEAGITIPRKDIAKEVQNLLRLLTYERMKCDKPSILVAQVRNEAGRVVYYASAELRRGTERHPPRLTGRAL